MRASILAMALSLSVASVEGSTVNKKESRNVALSPSSIQLLQSTHEGAKSGVLQALEAGADVNAKLSNEYLHSSQYTGPLFFEYGKTAIALAAYKNHTEIVEILLERGADANDTNGSSSILDIAILNKNVKMMKLLLEYGAEPNVRNSRGDSPLHTVAWEASNVWGISTAYETGDILPNKFLKMMRLLLSHGANPNFRGMDGRTPLMVCASVGFAEGIKLLLAHGADIDAETERGYTALFKSVKEGYARATKILLKHDAEVNATNRDGNTALHYAVDKGRNPRTVKLLLDRGADPELANKDGNTPVDMAIRELADVESIIADPFVASFYSSRISLNLRLAKQEKIVKLLQKKVKKGLLRMGR